MKKLISTIFALSTLCGSLPLLPATNVSAADLTLKADTLTAARGETVTFHVMLENNPGFDEISYAMTVDGDLTPDSVRNGGELQYDTDFRGVNMAHWNWYDARIGFGIISYDQTDGDGVLTAVQFTVPRSAEPGTVYHFRVVEDCQRLGLDGEYKEPAVIDGSITVTEGFPAGYGDVNLDGAVSVADAVLLARVIAEDTTVNVKPQGLSNADIDEYTGLTADDVDLLLRIVAGTYTHLM